MLSKYPSLVLNADYSPISVHPLSTWSFERTLRNYLKDRINVLESYDTTLRSPSFEYNPPSVVALKRYIKRPQRVVFNRYNIFLRDDFTCQYCAKRFSSYELTFDHVVPRSKGGQTSFDNIVACCVPCNTKKSNKQDVQPIKKPYTPNQRQLAKKKQTNLDVSKLHDSWSDYLYWSGVLQQDHGVI